jgi:hypothetical protein
MPILPVRLTQINGALRPGNRACALRVHFRCLTGALAMILSLARRLSRPVALTAVGVLAACASPQPLPIAEVVARSQQGQPPEQVISAVRSAKTTYAIRGSDFGRLKQAGVPDAVLDDLQQAFYNDVDLLTRYWVLGESVGGCTRCVPQQVSFVGTTPTQAPTRTAYTTYGPQGMPDWYRPYSASFRAFTLDQVEQMARSGAAEADLLSLVRGGKLDQVIGAQSPLSGIRTHPVATLSGSALARLREAGVPGPVLDEIQTVFLGQFVEIERLRYQNWGKGPSGSKT